MEAQIRELRLLGESCGLSGPELLDFVQSEREKLQKISRAERAGSLELKRQEQLNLESQIILENSRRKVRAT